MLYFGIKTEKDLDSLRFPVASMLLLSLINKVIDLGEEIIAGNKLEMPKSYRDVFRILEKNKLINKELGCIKEFEKMAKCMIYKRIKHLS